MHGVPMSYFRDVGVGADNDIRVLLRPFRKGLNHVSYDQVPAVQKDIIRGNMDIFTYRDHSLVIVRPVLASFFGSLISALIHSGEWRCVSGDADHFRRS